MVSVAAALQLRNKAKLQNIMDHCVELGVPQSLQKACRDEVGTLLIKTVSPSRVNRAQLAVDLTIMREVLGAPHSHSCLGGWLGGWVGGLVGGLGTLACDIG